ncbi:MAG: S49 family peptidase, partial [bacterium]|nr:S49 family peptidase [bacterium]
MKNKIRRILSWIGGMVVFGTVAVVVIVVIVVMKDASAMPDQVILTLDLEKEVVEYVPDDPLAKLIREDVQTVRTLVGSIDLAAHDDGVVGLIARVGDSPLGFAQIQEIRDAILAFRQSGKPTAVFAETFGEGGNGAYYLASAFDKIYLQPSGDVGLMGLRAEHPFVKGLLDSIDVIPRMAGRHEYKNAMNLFTEDHFTDAHREATEAMLQSMYGQIVRDLAVALDRTPDRIKELMDQGPFLGT